MTRAARDTSPGLPARIVGDPGTDPQAGDTGRGGRGEQVEPSPEPTGTLRLQDGKPCVEFDSTRVWLDDASARLVIDAWRRGGPEPRGRRQAPQALAAAIAVARREQPRIAAHPSVAAVRAGYRFVDGRITDTPCIVVEFDPRQPRPKLESEIDGIPVQAVPADPYRQLASEDGTESAALAQPALLIDQLQADEQEAGEEMARTISYRPPRGASLPELRAALSITCHVSPDAGWKVLEPFLKETQRSVVLGMYDFTAPHIYRTARSLLRDSDVTWSMTLGPNESLPGPDETDSTKADDKTEDFVNRGLKRVAGPRFQSAFASVGAGRTFASAYHIKVAVRDGSAFWLSSGNWQSSNQPAIDFLSASADRQLIASYNREWHVVVENEELAEVFQTYLKGDFDTANEPHEAAAAEEAAAAMPDLLVPQDALLFEERAAAQLQVFAPKRFVFTRQKPLRIQPILSPDNYVEVVRELLRRRPRRTLYFQNQSLNPVKQPTPEFEELMQRLVDYSNDPALDVRMIFRNIGPVRKKLESLQAMGFNMNRIRMQSGCHTKGIIVDSEIVLLGSHNFTNDGVQFNRDASLLMWDADIAGYYQDVFLHDWERLARPTVREEVALLATGDESEAAGFVRVPWSWYEPDR